MKKIRIRRHGSLGGIFLLLTIGLAAPAGGSESEILRAIDAVSPSYRNVSQQIWEWKELGQKEFQSSALLMEELKKLGFLVKGNLPVPTDLIQEGIARTAFKAEMAGKGPGPTITIMLEYDALANGHSCGHNLIATSGLMAAAGLAKIMPETPGRLVVMGTPDEERGSLGMGKVALLEGGHFDGSDVVFITHPADRWSLDQRFLAIKRAFFTFKGKAAHAAMAPHKGVNALRAAILMINSVDMLREHFRQDVRIHAIITKGGSQVNVVPELAQVEYGCRALDTVTMEKAFKKIVDCAKAAELVTEAKLEFKEPRVFLTAPIAVPPLTSLVAQKVRGIGIPAEEIRDFSEFASSDLGRVGYAYPTVNLWFKIAPAGTTLHSDAFREAAASEEGWKATILAAKAIALSAYELFRNPETVKEIQKSFQEMKAKEGK
jgi:amidohydrolase